MKPYFTPYPKMRLTIYTGKQDYKTFQRKYRRTSL